MTETEYYERKIWENRINPPVIEYILYGLSVNYISAQPFLTSKGVYDLAKTKYRVIEGKKKLEELVNRGAMDPSKKHVRNIALDEIDWVKKQSNYLGDLSKMMCEDNPKLNFYSYYELKIKNKKDAGLLAYLFKGSNNLAVNKEKKGEYTLLRLSGQWIKALQSQKENICKVTKDSLQITKKIVEEYDNFLVLQGQIMQDFGELTNPGHTFEDEEVLLKEKTKPEEGK